MATTVGELAADPALSLTVVAGEGGLGRRVTWAHTSDLPNPWEWLGPNELLLTNGTGLGAGAPAQVRFLERLDASGVSGLVIGLGTSRCRITPPLVERAGQLDFPVLTGPYSLRFADVGRAVARAADAHERDQLGEVARLYELMRISLSAGEGAPDLVGALGAELGVRLELLDPRTGRPVLGDEEPSRFGARLVAAYDPDEVRLGPVALSDEHGARVVAVGVPGGVPAALVVESTDRELPSPLVLQHLAIGAGLEIAQMSATRARQRARGATLLGDLLDGRADARLGTWQLEEMGLDLSSCVLAALTRASTADALSDLLVRARVDHVVAPGDRLVYVLVPEAALTETLVPIAEASGRHVGVAGDLSSGERVVRAAAEAAWALRVAQLEDRRVARFSDAEGPLLPHSPVEARAVVRSVLGPLLDYDAAHRTEYVTTLSVLMECDRSWREAATRLHVHRQTLAYRIRRIEQLTGRAISRTDDLAAFWFALRAYALLDGYGRHGAPG